MNYYKLSVSRVLRVLNNPLRVEDGVAEGTIAAMQPTSQQHTSEIWLMYQKDQTSGQIKIITAWRYPGKSPVRGSIPIPEEIRRDLIVG